MASQKRSAAPPPPLPPPRDTAADYVLLVNTYSGISGLRQEYPDRAHTQFTTGDSHSGLPSVMIGEGYDERSLQASVAVAGADLQELLSTGYVRIACEPGIETTTGYDLH